MTTCRSSTEGALRGGMLDIPTIFRAVRHVLHPPASSEDGLAPGPTDASW
ncbi:hypothetical protein HF920_05340 [Acidithiobacillus ferriphilus]|nr:hypothetical protein [Acidithiobacillus ferriphilus]